MKKIIALFYITSFLFIAVASSCFAEEEIVFSDEEIVFINEHPIVRFGVDPGFIPFEFIDKDGQYKGITADYLTLISKKTNIKFEIAKGLTWPQAYDIAMAGELDGLPAVGKTEEREKSFLFSEPYYYFKRVIVTSDSYRKISDIEDLEGTTVAVQRNSSHHSYLLSFPNINLSLYDSVEASLAAVATGTEQAYLGNLATTSYLIRSNGITNLRTITFEAEKEQALHFAVRKDWPQLISILNKALDKISDKEKMEINKKWVDLKQDVDYGPIIRIFIIIGALVFVIIAVSFYWIARLKKEIKKRKEIQVDLERAKHEADEANEFKSCFMARMSHEIRTPLNAITGMAYLLKRTDLTLTQRMFADRITQASSNMLSIINDILDFSKIEAGKIELEMTSFSLDQVIQDVVNIVSYKIEEQKIGFNISKDPSIPNWFFGDSKRIEQILINVLNNAAKFTSTGEVSLDIRLIAKENEKYHLAFSIKDTGIGMTQEQVQKLFEPFTQGDTSINRRFGGSGLGLSIVKNLLDMMGGQIQVFSTAGEGSTFVINLSLDLDKEKETAFEKTLSTDCFNKLRTLVLEKTGASMNLIEGYLNTLGMNCMLTSSPSAAIRMLEDSDGQFTKPFDLVIVDYDTPPQGAFEFIEAVRNNKKITKEPKFIMLLPMMREDLFDKLNEKGVDIGIGKPIIPSVLYNALLELFKLKAVSSQLSDDKDSTVIRFDKQYLVLVVEDNKTNQLIAKSLLNQVGIETLQALDGKEGVEIYNEYKGKIDLILMDLHMPEMNGYEAAREIRKLSDTIPIVAMTADVILGVKEKCESSGIHYYISKPFDPDRFIQTVKDILVKDNADYHKKAVLNQSAGLENVGQDLEVYKEVLKEYMAENGDIIDKLSYVLSEKRYTDGIKIVHKVKSSSGSIGAESIYKLAVKLQRAFEEVKEDDIHELFRAFSANMNKLFEDIKELID